MEENIEIQNSEEQEKRERYNPDNIFKKVDFPVPFTPIRPIFSPSFIPKDILLTKIFSE